MRILIYVLAAGLGPFALPQPLAAQGESRPATLREILWCDPATGDFIGCDRITEKPREGLNWEQLESCRMFWSLGGERGHRLSPHWSVRFAGPLPGRGSFVFVHKQGVERIHAKGAKIDHVWPFDERGALLFGWAAQGPFGRRLLVPGMSFERLDGQLDSGCFLGIVDFREKTRKLVHLGSVPTGVIARGEDAFIAYSSRFSRLSWDESDRPHLKQLGPITPGWSLLGLSRGLPVFLGENHQSLLLAGKRWPLGRRSKGRFLMTPKGLWELEEGTLRQLGDEGALVERQRFGKGNILGFGRRPGGDGVWVFPKDSQGRIFSSAPKIATFSLKLPQF